RIAAKKRQPTDTLHRLKARVAPQSVAHSTAATQISAGLGEKTSTNPLSFANAEKLETQNGMRNRRIVCQRSSVTLFSPAVVVLMNNAKPMMRLNPSEVSQR